MYRAGGAAAGAPGGGLPAGVQPGDILIWNGASWVPSDEMTSALAPKFVNSATGNDTNDGLTAGTALLTLGELGRRYQGRTVTGAPFTITLTGTFPAEVLVLACTTYVNITIAGVVTLSINGITTAFTALAAPGTRAVLADTTTPIVWAARAGQRIRLTSGANTGAIATVLSDGGANTARVSQFTSLTTFLGVSPAVNDTFAVETLDTVLGGIQIDCLGTGLIAVEDVTVALTGGTNIRLQAAGNTNNGCTIRKCRFDGVQTVFGAGSAFNLTACSNSSTAAMVVGRDCQCFMAGHAAFGNLTFSTPNTLIAAAATCLQACRLIVENSSVLDIATTVAIFDFATANPCIDVSPGSCVNATATVMGVNITTTGVGIRARSKAGYVWTVAPTITGAGGDTSIGGVVTTYVAIAAAPGAAIMNPNNGAVVGVRA